MGDLESPQQNAAHYVALFNVLLRDKQWMLSITSMGGIVAGVTREVEKSPVHKRTFINHKESGEYQMAGKRAHQAKGKMGEAGPQTSDFKAFFFFFFLFGPVQSQICELIITMQGGN